VLRRENGKVLKENSLLHMEIIRKEEECDERIRAAAAASRKLEVRRAATAIMPVVATLALKPRREIQDTLC
jgi:hypothetical protein